MMRGDIEPWNLIHCWVCGKSARVNVMTDEVECRECGSSGTWHGGHHWTVTHNTRGGACLGVFCQTVEGG